MTEEWRTIAEWPKYQVSDLGRVRRDGRVLSQGKNLKGYLTVGLSDGARRKTRTVHRLVALAFIPNPDNLPEVNHIDAKRDNARADNLEWMTRSQQGIIEMGFWGWGGVTARGGNCWRDSATWRRFRIAPTHWMALPRSPSHLAPEPPKE